MTTYPTYTGPSTIKNFLADLTRICEKYKIEEIYTQVEEGQRPTTVVRFTNNQEIIDLEYHRTDRGASAWWEPAQRFAGR